MTNQKLESWKKVEQIQRIAVCVSTQLYGQTNVYYLIFTPKNTAPHWEYGWDIIKHKNISVPKHIWKHRHTLR